ncbi:MAG: histidine triad nucleotide-binding protein [Deltaproteobacteria bacterium]|nr:MAG: histidine triad nucleotide-binding protein [Deltaproteobacteria bacterium]
MSGCIFCKIASGEIPAEIVHRDDLCVAFRDINPAAPQHILLIPVEHIPSMNSVAKDHAALLGHMMTVLPGIAEKAGVAESGYRTVINCNSDAGQEVFHLHIHLLGGRKLAWPPG